MTVDLCYKKKKNKEWARKGGKKGAISLIVQVREEWGTTKKTKLLNFN